MKISELWIIRLVMFFVVLLSLLLPWWIDNTEAVEPALPTPVFVKAGKRSGKVEPYHDTSYDKTKHKKGKATDCPPPYRREL